MSYTHYFNGLECSAELAEIAARIAELSPVFGPHGEGEPIISASVIQLNGDASKGQDYETFHVPGPRERTERVLFCTTNHKPYDSAVTAILSAAVMLESQGWESISSDARNVLRWQRGIRLLEQAIGHDLDDITVSHLVRQVGGVGNVLPLGCEIRSISDFEWADMRERSTFLLHMLFSRGGVSNANKRSQIDLSQIFNELGCGLYDFQCLDDKSSAIPDRKAVILEEAVSVALIWDVAANKEASPKERKCSYEDLLKRGHENGVEARLAALKAGVPLDDITGNWRMRD